MKKVSKLFALLLAALLVVASLAGCTGNNESKPAESQSQSESESANQGDQMAADVYGNKYEPTDWAAESEQLYNDILGDFLEAYAKVKDAETVSERYALQAISEAILYENGVFVPTITQGGNYRLGRTVPKSVNTTLWGSNSYRYNTILVTEELMKAEDWAALKVLWAEKAGTGEYIDAAKAYLADKGYTLKDSYTMSYTTDPTTWDFLGSSRATTGEAVSVTVDGLYTYNEENVQVPAIATSYEVSEDGLTYTFKLRDDVVWVDSQGRKVSDLTADDFVAGLQHLLDCESSPRGLLVGVLKGANEYISGETTDIAEVGIKAVDDYTLEYTLEKEVPYFMSMMAYNIFVPMSRTFYTANGGKFGAEFDDTAEDYTYGTDPDHIAYCGPMIITNYTANNTVTYVENESYYDKEQSNIKTMTWLYNDGTDKLKAYNDCIEGTVDAAGLNTDAVEKCKADGYFDDYVALSETNATTFCGWINVNRKIYTNFNSEAVPSLKTVKQADDSVIAMRNVHFRRALIAAFDRAAYNAQSVGEELKYNRLRNSYVPATFVSLAEDVTVDINGEEVTFPAGTFYGQIIQAKLDADNIPIKVWDAEAASGDGYDGWYNPEFAKAELAEAAKELAEAGITLSADSPIYLDYPCAEYSPIGQNQGQAVKQSIEAATDGMIIINLTSCTSSDEESDTSYNTQYGYEQNMDFTTSSGWGPDYGDPQTYLATLVIDEDGYMLANLGMFGQ